MNYNKNDGLRYYFEDKVKSEEHHVASKYGLEYEFPTIPCNWLDEFSKFEKFIEKYHENVNLGIAVSGDGLLTDHGVEHINSVMRHVVDIMLDPRQLTGYEMFILMYAIHFHDLGNITGRQKHEEKIREIMAQMIDHLSLSPTERQVIRAIATAHGGYVDEDKDTIRYVEESYTNGSAIIRPQVLAALLRFADEVSDDLCRSDFEGINIPDQNKIFHAYSKSLTPISIKGDTIKLTYAISYEQTQKMIPGPGGKLYLYDEILNRLEKMIIELEYCRKYSQGMIRIKTLDVEIHIFDGEDEIKGYTPPFRLTLQGYPNRNYANLEYYREKNENRELKYINGKKLKKDIYLAKKEGNNERQR